MATEAISVPKTQEDTFETGNVLTIVGGHFVHDTYNAFLPTLLPLLIEKYSLSLTMAGFLPSISQIGAILNPFIGYLADKVSLRYFVIFAPGLTGTLLSSLGLAPDYFFLLILLFASGVSTAIFHAPAPAMVGRISGNQIGKGMSYFMAGGELGRTIAPLLVVWGISIWTLDGFWRMAIFGWVATIILYLRLRNIPARTRAETGLKGMIPILKKLALPFSTLIFLRVFSVVSISIYLPTFLDQQGASLWIAGGALAIAQAAGVAGALFSGPVSDRWGRRRVLFVTIGGGSLFILLFLSISGWVMVPVLVAMGFLLLSSQPVLLAIVQEQFPEHRALANGLFMLLSFATLSLATFIVGWVGDLYGLNIAYFGSAVLGLLALPLILKIPIRPGIPD